VKQYTSHISQVVFSKEKLNAKLAECAKQEHDAAYWLYDNGYSSVPVVKSVSEVLFSFFDEDTTVKDLLLRQTGELDLSALRFEYASMLTMNTNLHIALHHLAKLVEARAIMDDIKGIAGYTRFPKRTDSVILRVTPSLYQGSVNYYKKPYLETGNLRSCVGERGMQVLDVDMNVYRLAALRNAGYNDISGRGDEVDLKFLPLYASGDVIGEGADGYRFYNDFASWGDGLRRVLEGTLDFCTERLEFLKLKKCLYITTRYAVFETPYPEKKKEFNFRDYEMGSFATGGSPTLQFMGYGGEFIPQGDFPLAIETTQNINDEDVPLYVVPSYIVTGGLSDISEVDDVYIDETYVCNLLGVQDLSLIRREVVNTLGQSTVWNMLLGELIQSYCYALCDVTKLGRRSARHIVLGSEFKSLTRDDFNRACRVVEKMLGALGLI